MRSRVFEDGALEAELREVNNGTEFQVPKPLLVAAPRNPGEYPVVLLFHGFSLLNTFYSQLMQHISSHGFIVVAPQMYKFCGPNAAPEISEAADVINWIAGNSQRFVRPQVKANMSKLVVMGHSRGGKVAFGLALGLAKHLSHRISALVGLDPVDGTSDKHQTSPPILKFQKDALNTGCPVLIIGAGLGTQRKLLFPPCAPEGVGFKAFYSDCCAPAFLFTAPEHGHLDFLNDSTGGIRGMFTALVARGGNDRRSFRRFTGGVTAAFLQSVLNGETGPFRLVFEDPGDAPVRLDTPQGYGEI